MRDREERGPHSQDIFYLDLGFTSYEDYFNALKDRPPSPDVIRPRVDPHSHLDPVPISKTDALRDWGDQYADGIKNLDVWKVLDTTREKLEEWMIDKANATLDLLIKVSKKDSLSYHLLHILKGAAPQLIPYIFILLGAWGLVVVLLLNLPLLKDKLVPFLARCWKDFFKDVEELGPKAAVIKFINSLSQILDQIVDHYRERFANAKTIEEKEEILGELLGYGIVTLETGVGVAKVAVKSGKAISRLPGKIPPQMRALEAHLSQQLGSMSETLGPKKMGEVLERIQLKASQVKRAGAAAGDVNAAGAGVEGQVWKSLEAQSSGAELVSSKGSQLVEAQATKAAQENLLGVIEQRTETLRLQRNAAAREAAFETGKWVIVTRSGEKIVKNVSKRKPELFGRSVVGKKYTAITQLEDLPIHFDHAKNFRGASFWDIAPQPGETFIRWGNAEGSWWARVPPESNFQSMIDLAILYEWNKWDRISYFTVPKSGVPWTFFEGYAGSQAGQMSKVSRTGASSIYIGNKGQVYIRREIYNTDEFKKLVITESAKDYFSKPRK